MSHGNARSHGQVISRPPAINQGERFRKYGKETDSKRRRPEERRAFGACEQDTEEDEESQDLYNRDGKLVFSATQLHVDEDDEDGEDRHAMMGRRDYDFNGSDEEDGSSA
jgi:hypothetical protein